MKNYPHNIKPIKYARLKAEMDQWLKKHRKDDSPAMVIANDTGRYKVFLKSLRYIEIFNRNSRIKDTAVSGKGAGYFNLA